MRKSVESVGKTIDEAINAAVKQLGVERDSVSVEVLGTPQKGFLGIGATLAKVLVSIEIDSVVQGVSFLESVLKQMNVNASMDIKKDIDGVRITLSGEDMGIVIGRRGETLDALQYLTSLVINKDKEDYVKVTLDTENYRHKREETLQRLASKLCEKVLRYRKSITLEPMNPYERRIIHASLQDKPGITTYSTGTEPNRSVVIALAKLAPLKK